MTIVTNSRNPGKLHRPYPKLVRELICARALAIDANQHPLIAAHWNAMTRQEIDGLLAEMGVHHAS